MTFDIYRGSQFEGGNERRALAPGAATTDVVLLPEGTYYVISNYGDSNAVVRSDIRVTAGKLTDVVVNHRAAVITLKLVSQAGGEARQHAVVGAHPRRRRREGSDRCLPEGDSGRRRILRRGEERRQGLQRKI